jgi:PBP1b-binding outer membrane lipoprotein LpoB
MPFIRKLAVMTFAAFVLVGCASESDDQDAAEASDDQAGTEQQAPAQDKAPVVQHGKLTPLKLRHD